MARRRAEPGVDRRQRILDAALEAFAELGFDGVTTKDIATRADVTQGLLYFYFPKGKEELFAEAFEQQAVIALEQLTLGDTLSAEPPETVIPQALERLILVVSEPRFLGVFRLIARATFSGDQCDQPGAKARERFRALGHIITDRLTVYLDGQIAAGRLKPINTALTSQLLLGAVMMMAVRRAKGDEHVPQLATETFVAELADLFLHGMLRPAEIKSVSQEAPSTTVSKSKTASPMARNSSGTLTQRLAKEPQELQV